MGGRKKGREVPEFELKKKRRKKKSKSTFTSKVPWSEYYSSGIATGQQYRAHFPARVCKITYIALPAKNENRVRL